MQDQAATLSNSTLRRQMIILTVWAVVCAVAVTVSAQPPKKSADELDPALKPRPVQLETRDGLTLRAFYFPSDKGKEAVPVMLVHEWSGQGAPYTSFVLALQKAGCAVLVPEYRGHGGSRSFINARGEKQEFQISRMSRTDIANIISLDLESAKKFLKEENNAGRLNLNSLVIVGIGEGAISVRTGPLEIGNFQVLEA